MILLMYWKLGKIRHAKGRLGDEISSQNTEGQENNRPYNSHPYGQPKPESSMSVLSNILSKIVNHPIVSVIGLIASLLGIGAVVHDACLGPEISSDLNADPSEPFAFPFIVKNNSAWFSMYDAEMNCGIEKITMTNNRFLEGISVAPIKHATIGPGEIVNFRCVAAGVPGWNLIPAKPGDILDAHINIIVKYTTLGFSRASSPTEFTWLTSGTPHHWIKGKLIS
jgi:hypothetical protein